MTRMRMDTCSDKQEFNQLISDVLSYNHQFVLDGKYKPHVAGNLPRKKLAIVTCMDTRLTTLLPAALGFKNGDAKIIKTAGAIINEPYGSVMRSLLIAIYGLGVKTILVIGHHDCGARSVSGKALVKSMEDRGITEEQLTTASKETDVAEWLEGFHHLGHNVKSSVALVRNHPLVPDDIVVKGLVIDPHTGELSDFLDCED